MTFDEIVKEVVRVCKNNKSKSIFHYLALMLRGNSDRERSDIDFIVYGVKRY